MNVTPLIDVLLVLLVVGLVSFGLSRRSVAVSLPPVSGSPIITHPILLELASGGGYSLNGQPIPPHQLSDQLAALFRTRPVKILFIKTAAERTYQEFIQAADLARGAGVMTIAVVGN